MTLKPVLMLALALVFSSCSTSSDNPPPIVIGQAEPVEIIKPKKERPFDVHGELSLSTSVTSRL